MFGAAIAARRGEHLAVTLVAEALPRAGRRAIFVLSVALSAALLGLTAWFAWSLVDNQIGSGVRSYALQIPMWYYSAALPLGFLLILARTVEHARDWLTGDSDVTPDPGDAPHV